MSNFMQHNSLQSSAAGPPEACFRQLWSSSEKYVSFEAKEKERFEWWRKKQRRNSKLRDSPFLPKTWKEYLAHRKGMLDDVIAESKALIAARQGKKGRVEAKPAFGGKAVCSLTGSLDRYGQWRETWKGDGAGLDHSRSRDFKEKGLCWLGRELADKL